MALIQSTHADDLKTYNTIRSIKYCNILQNTTELNIENQRRLLLLILILILK